jgi:2,5-diamino-6-(ribosylamino)-4(3H)-pyrimidinone 5'-phosphate reductase
MHVRVNAAMSADGKLSTRRREQVRISGPEDFDRVDDLRADADAVMVGVGTVTADDPRLVLDHDRQADRRAEGRSPNPARVVADSRARMPPDARVLDDAGDSYVLVAEAAPDGRVARLEQAGATVVRAGAARVDLAAAFEQLEASHDVAHVMVEGGGEIIFSLFDAGLVDDCSVFVGPQVIGGRDAPTLADGEGFVDDFVDLELDDVARLDDGVVLHWRVA